MKPWPLRRHSRKLHGRLAEPIKNNAPTQLCHEKITLEEREEEDKLGGCSANENASRSSVAARYKTEAAAMAAYQG